MSGRQKGSQDSALYKIKFVEKRLSFTVRVLVEFDGFVYWGGIYNGESLNKVTAIWNGTEEDDFIHELFLPDIVTFVFKDLCSKRRRSNSNSQFIIDISAIQPRKSESDRFNINKIISFRSTNMMINGYSDFCPGNLRPKIAKLSKMKPRLPPPELPVDVGACS